MPDEFSFSAYVQALSDLGITSYEQAFRPLTQEKRRAKLRAQRQDAIESLRKILPAGTEVATIIRHSTSNQRSHYLAVLVAQDGRVVEISKSVAQAIKRNMGDRWNGVRMGQADAWDAPVYLCRELSQALWDAEDALRVKRF